jgi:hypothetical protein
MMEQAAHLLEARKQSEREETGISYSPWGHPIKDLAPSSRPHLLKAPPSPNSAKMGNKLLMHKYLKTFQIQIVAQNYSGNSAKQILDLGDFYAPSPLRKWFSYVKKEKISKVTLIFWLNCICHASLT